jgi:hypothetical protein
MVWIRDRDGIGSVEVKSGVDVVLLQGPKPKVSRWRDRPHGGSLADEIRRVSNAQDVAQFMGDDPLDVKEDRVGLGTKAVELVIEHNVRVQNAPRLDVELDQGQGNDTSSRTCQGTPIGLYGTQEVGTVRGVSTISGSQRSLQGGLGDLLTVGYLAEANTPLGGIFPGLEGL